MAVSPFDLGVERCFVHDLLPGHPRQATRKWLGVGRVEPVCVGVLGRFQRVAKVWLHHAFSP
jgi:hypothetical protein